MEKPGSIGRFIANLGLLAVLLVMLFAAFELFKPGERPASQSLATNEPTPYPGIETEAPPAAEGSPSPYPGPGAQVTPTPYVPQILQELYANAALSAGVKTALLEHGVIWVAQSGIPPYALAELSEVAVLYGWNHDGTKLLFGRGLYDTYGEWDKSTQLWVYDLAAGKAYVLAESTKIWSASWSPVDDRVAYIEFGETPTAYVVSVEGEILQKRNEYFAPELAWSPDGTAIALSYSGPDMVKFDERATVLSVWRLEKDELEVMSKAKWEDHFSPVWLMDGYRILFIRLVVYETEDEKSGFYIADTQKKQIFPLANGPKTIGSRVKRSPRSDVIVFASGQNVYLIKLGEEPIVIGRGSMPVWHPDGQTVIFVGEYGLYQIETLDLPVADMMIGGNYQVITIPLQPGIFFHIEENK